MKSSFSYGTACNLRSFEYFSHFLQSSSLEICFDVMYVIYVASVISMGVARCAISAMDGKCCKKLQKYIQLSEFAKFKSYVKRHSVDMIGLLDEQGNSLLHLSCKYGCEVILRLIEDCSHFLLYVVHPDEICIITEHMMTTLWLRVKLRLELGLG